MPDLAGRSVLLTGASGALGTAFARALVGGGMTGQVLLIDNGWTAR